MGARQAEDVGPTGHGRTSRRTQRRWPARNRTPSQLARAQSLQHEGGQGLEALQPVPSNSSSDEHKMATVDPATQGVAPPRDARATHQWEARGGARMVAGRLALLGAARRPRLIRSIAKRYYHAQYRSNHVQYRPAMKILPLNRPTGEGRHSKTSPWSP